ncbi:MAG: hypothetical protein DPW18_15510 [Chloroflexi bacterium]|nr:hypothetical protein [Chloroflexota bacterium]MDL1944018.1 hypothetical protein [Chloroflexi bacterium CFX2]
MFQYEAKLLQIVDGDTLKLQIDLGFNVHIIEVVRLVRINTPETVHFSARGIEDPARRYIEENCPVGTVLVVDISRREKYGRWLAEVRFLPGEVDRVKILQNPRNLNDELLRAGLALPYAGGKR